MNKEHMYWDEVERWFNLFETDISMFKSQFNQEFEQHLLDGWPSSKIHQYLAMLIPRFSQGIEMNPTCSVKRCIS